MTAATVLPHVNAVLNAISTILIVIAFSFIRAGRRDMHRKVMLAAIIVSAVFLVCYLAYHFTAPIFVFRGTGWTIPLYYSLLVSHVILAVAVTPMVAYTAWQSLHGHFEKHRAIARWTLPIWLYVTITGVVIYTILYHVYPVAA